MKMSEEMKFHIWMSYSEGFRKAYELFNTMPKYTEIQIENSKRTFKNYSQSYTTLYLEAVEGIKL